MARLAALWGLSGQLVAAAALLALLVLPAVMQRGVETSATPAPGGKLDLSVHAGGQLRSFWSGTAGVPCTRCARPGHGRNLAKVNAIEVQGGRFTDAAGPVSGGPDIVFYQVD